MLVCFVACALACVFRVSTKPNKQISPPKPQFTPAHLARIELECNKSRQAWARLDDPKNDSRSYWHVPAKLPPMVSNLLERIGANPATTGIISDAVYPALFSVVILEWPYVRLGCFLEFWQKWENNYRVECPEPPPFSSEHECILQVTENEKLACLNFAVAVLITLLIPLVMLVEVFQSKPYRYAAIAIFLHVGVSCIMKKIL